MSEETARELIEAMTELTSAIRENTDHLHSNTRESHQLRESLDRASQDVSNLVYALGRTESSVESLDRTINQASSRY
jgi:predicted nuclease with TOPRIM domain